ncbi:MAG TPA: hypothetical protein VGM80_14595 [Gaiellaceae bacterium]
MATSRSGELHAVAARIAAALPAEVVEVVLTGSVSRGVADELSDIEMLFVTTERLALTECFELARAVGLENLDSWGPQGTEVSRVFGYFEQVPIELIWWPRGFAEASIASLLAGEPSAAADALANGLSFRTVGLLAAWQDALASYSPELAAGQIEEAALTWGGFHPSGFLTLTRPGDRLALVERLLDDASRVLRIVYALNRVWRPTSKRLLDRVHALPLKPERLAERIDEALMEPDPSLAMLAMSRLQLDTLALAPAGPNVSRARGWLKEVVEVLSRTE